MQFISYAQNFEDVMLWRALKDVKNGFYIDVGAHDPVLLSVSKAFYDRDWHGINLEPVTNYFEKLKNQRTRDINLQVLAGNQETEVSFYEIPESGLSTLDLSIAEKHSKENNLSYIERKASMQTLTKICEKHKVDQIHFLKIDVEGAEDTVLDGIDLKIIRPWIILIEATLPMTQISSFEKWEPKLLNNQYDFVYFDGLNRFYLANEHSKLKKAFCAPPNIFDQFLTIDNINLQKQAAMLTEELVKKEKELNVLKNELTNKEDTITLIIQTFSWRVTKPLRVLKRMTKRGLKKNSKESQKSRQKSEVLL